MAYTEEDIRQLNLGHYPPDVEHELRSCLESVGAAEFLLQREITLYNSVREQIAKRVLYLAKEKVKLADCLSPLIRAIRRDTAPETAGNAECLSDWADALQACIPGPTVLPDLPELDLVCGEEGFPDSPGDCAVWRAEESLNGEPYTRPEPTMRIRGESATIQVTDQQTGRVMQMRVAAGGQIEAALHLRSAEFYNMPDVTITRGVTPDLGSLASLARSLDAVVEPEEIVDNALSAYYKECARMKAEDEAAGRVHMRRTYASYQEEAKRVATLNRMRRIVGLPPIRTL